MSNGAEQADIKEFEAAVNFFYDKFNTQSTNHFELLGLTQQSTHREIEAAYQKYAAEFSVARVAQLTDPVVRKKGDFLIQRGKMAYDTLVDFQKRAAYEKRGFKEESEVVVEEDDEEKAKTIYLKAKSLKTMKDYHRAALAMEEAIKLDDKKPAYYLMLGMCQTNVPELKRKAEQNLLKASQMESWNAEPYAALGMLFYSERLVKRAETYFRKALELEPGHALAKAKLTEIVGPEVKPLDVAKKQLGKLLPSLFGKKK